MSSYTDQEWFYYINGRNIELYQILGGSSSERITQSGVIKSRKKELVYPDENITNGLRFEGTAFIEPFVDVDPNELSGNDNPSLVVQTSPDEADHVNLSRMLSLAVVDYIKAMMADTGGDLERKEYYMREFWKKAGDNESNKRVVSLSFPASPFAVR